MFQQAIEVCVQLLIDRIVHGIAVCQHNRTAYFEICSFHIAVANQRVTDPAEIVDHLSVEITHVEIERVCIYLIVDMHVAGEWFQETIIDRSRLFDIMDEGTDLKRYVEEEHLRITHMKALKYRVVAERRVRNARHQRCGIRADGSKGINRMQGTDGTRVGQYMLRKHAYL